MVLTLNDEITVKSKLYDGVEFTIKVLTPKDVETIVLDGDKKTTNAELAEKYCLSVKGVEYHDKEITDATELINIGGTTRLIGEIASSILNYAFLGDEEKND